MTNDPLFDRAREELVNQSASIPVRVTAIDLSGEPQVSVVPLDGEGALPIHAVPYVFPSSSAFAVFIPPAVGMEGYLVATNKEVADNTVERFHDRASGVFIPGGMSPLTQGTPFKGNAGWSEMRSATCRVAMSENEVHLQAGDTSIALTNGQFDIVVSGVSLVAALKQMSAHIKKLEELIHPNGMIHGPVNVRMVDSLTAATIPTRSETGVR